MDGAYFSHLIKDKQSHVQIGQALLYDIVRASFTILLLLGFFS